MTTTSTRLLRITRENHRSDHTTNIDASDGDTTLPLLLTVAETANLLRTSSRAIYAMVERNQLPGVVRIRRRVLVRTSELLDWFDQKRASSLRSER